MGLTDRPPEKDQITQTDPLMDRPPPPLFVPAKIGRDVSTQIEPGDLFNFAVEVEPILEVLVGKTLEQAMDEVLEEEELANIRKHRAAFEQQRLAEKNRRTRQESIRVQQEEEVMEKVAARGFAKTYLTDLHHAVLESLVQSGHFFDPVEKEVESVFMPWLRESASGHLENITTARTITSNITKGVVQAQQVHLDAYARYVKFEKERQAALEVLRKQEQERLARLAEDSDGDG